MPAFMPKESLDKTLNGLASTLRQARELITALRKASVTKFEVIDKKTGEYFAYPRPHPFDPVAKTENQPVSDSALLNIYLILILYQSISYKNNSQE